MTRRQLATRLRALGSGERGFTIIETLIAITVVFASLTALAYTATIGFRYLAISRDRIKATGAANQIMEEIRSLAYTKVTTGLLETDISGDPNIVNCSGTYYYPDCSGDKLVTSNIVSSYDAPWLYPHRGTTDYDGLSVDWATYVTNDDPDVNPYRVTVAVTFPGSGGDDTITVHSFFWSPTGCVGSSTHPYAAPCQPYLYGLGTIPTGSIRVTPILGPSGGGLHADDIDFVELDITLQGVEASATNEQVTSASGSTTFLGALLETSTDTTTVGGVVNTSNVDNDPGSSLVMAGGVIGATGAGSTLNILNQDCCNEIGLKTTIAAGGSASLGASTAATAADAWPCPTSGTRETDSLPCSGGQILQGGTLTVAVPFTHVLPSLGTANLLRIQVPSTASSVTVDKDEVSGYDGIVGVNVARYLGTIQIGGFPSAGMAPPTGMSATVTNDTNYCVRIAGYADTARVVGGERSSTNPSGSITGTLHYYNGSSFSNVGVTSNPTLPITSCTKTATVDGHSVTWKVSVSANGWTSGKVDTATNNVDADDDDIHYDVVQTVSPPALTVNYILVVDGVDEVAVSVAVDLGQISAQAVYEPAPGPQGG